MACLGTREDPQRLQGWYLILSFVLNSFQSLANDLILVELDGGQHCFTGPIGDFSGGTVVGNPPASAGDTGSNPGLGRYHMPWSN